MRIRTLAFLVALPACTSTVEGAPVTDDDADGGASSSSSSSSGGQSSGGFEKDAGPPATRPPPVITGVSPLEGDYGTPITITGDNLDEASAALSLATPTEPLTIKMSAAASPSDVIVTKWSKTEIVFKYPFPAEGAVRVTTASGQADGGSFTPSWTPGSPLSGVFSRRETLAVVSPSAGRLVAAFDGATGPKLVVAEPDGAVTAKSFSRGPTLLFQASLWVTSSGQVDGIFAAEGVLWTITDAAGAATTTKTSIAAARAAGGLDATGPYAWIANGASITRHRAPTWAATADVVTDPSPADAPGKSLAVGTDHSLYAGWGVNSNGSFPLYDHTSRPMTRRLRPGQTTFDAARSVGGGADDYMSFTRFRAGPGGRVASYYCANDTGLFSSTSWDCGEGYVADLAPPAIAGSTEYVPGWNASTTVTTYCDGATKAMKLGAEGNTASHTAPLFPCPHVAAIAADVNGDPVFVAWSGAYLYAPKKR